jgi:UDP-2,4-diacetamido-2,4,6-trideoxy-beta-L-altropyranose hydrolase
MITMKFQYRKASKKDVKDVYELSNEEQVRQNSINKEKFNYLDHIEWFSRAINANDYRLYIVEDDSEFVGQVKFQIIDGTASISISIHQGFRGAGNGKTIILESINFLRLDIPEINEIVAFIDPKNTASIKSFLSAEFKSMGTQKFGPQDYNKYICRIHERQV